MILNCNLPYRCSICQEGSLNEKFLPNGINDYAYKEGEEKEQKTDEMGK